MATTTSDTPTTAVAKVFMHGRSQAVRLPKAFRVDSDRVRVRRAGRGLYLEPVITDIDEWFAAMDRHQDVDFMPDGREQPGLPAERAW